MSIIKYLSDKGWREKVDNQIVLEKKISRHTSDCMPDVIRVILCVPAGIFALMPGTAFFEELDMIQLAMMFMFFIYLAVVIYMNKFLLIEESGKRINIYTKYKNVPVEKSLLSAAKLVLLTKRCIRYMVVYQGLNLFVRVIWYIITGRVYWSLLNLWPAAVVLVVYISECIRLRLYEAKMC